MGELLIYVSDMPVILPTDSKHDLYENYGTPRRFMNLGTTILEKEFHSHLNYEIQVTACERCWWWWVTECLRSL